MWLKCARAPGNRAAPTTGLAPRNCTTSAGTPRRALGRAHRLLRACRSASEQDGYWRRHGMALSRADRPGNHRLRAGHVAVRRLLRRVQLPGGVTEPRREQSLDRRTRGDCFPEPAGLRWIAPESRLVPSGMAAPTACRAAPLRGAANMGAINTATAPVGRRPAR